jgi:PAS domain S-box-containing protein
MANGIPLESLQEREELCSLLIARVKDYAIFMLSPTGKIMSWNEGARLIKGYTRDEIVGESMEKFYPPEAIARGLPQQLLRRAVEQGRAEDEGWRVRKDGTRFWANVVITALRDEVGTLTGFAKITRDLSERRKADAAIGELSGRLIRLQDEERQRLAQQLHDRTSPYLSAVLASLYNLKEQGSDVSDAITKVEAASDVIRRVSHMLHPPRLERGLADALRWYIDAISGHVGFAVEADLPTAPVPVSKEGEIVLFRLVQECFGRMMGRGGSREASIRLITDGRAQLEITIHGLLPARVRSAIMAEEGDFGVGFAGIRERLRQLGGALTVTTGDGKTVVEASLPLER